MNLAEYLSVCLISGIIANRCLTTTDTVLLFVISMFLIAAYVYLPNHIVTVCHHVWYYWAGDPSTRPSSLGYRSAKAAATESLMSAAQQKGYEVIKETARAAAETPTATVERFAEL